VGGSRGGFLPHDPAAAPDGSLWFTGMHSISSGGSTQDRGDKAISAEDSRLRPPWAGGRQEGNIWFTANYKGYIGKLKPLTGEVVEYPMPTHPPAIPIPW
jgi:virginiamycin B lyase